MNTHYARSVVFALAWVMAAAGLAGCTALSPTNTPTSLSSDSSAASPAPTTPMPCDGSTAIVGTTRVPDFSSGISFTDPFYAADVIGVARDQSQELAAAPGTPQVGVVSMVDGGSAVVGGSATPVGSGIVGFDTSTGKALWGLNLTQFASNFLVFSNGVDTLAVVTTPFTDQPMAEKVQTVDAASGKVLSSGTWTASAFSVAGMACNMIAIVADNTVSGYRTSDLSTPVWQKPAPQSLNDGQIHSLNPSPMIGQNVLTGNGYVKIADGTPSSFGADSIWPVGYLQAGDGSVFRAVVPAAGGAAGTLQRYDPATGKALWPSPISNPGLTGCGDGWCPNAMVSNNTFIANCSTASLCGYSLSTGQQIWQTAVTPLNGNGQVMLDGDAGRYYFLYTWMGGDLDITATQVSDGKNTHDLGSTAMVFGQSIAYRWNSTTITALDATSDSLGTLWTTPMPTVSATSQPTGLEQVGATAGQMVVMGGDGQVWIARPPQP